MANFRLPGLSGSGEKAPVEKPKTLLEKRQDELRTTFTEMQWDLGGAAYEMAARDYFRLDVLAKMAAKLQVVDAELAEIERMSRLEQAGAAGACAGCGSLYARGAVYCWRCGRNVAQAGSAVVLPAGTAVTPAPTKKSAVPPVVPETETKPDPIDVVSSPVEVREPSENGAAPE